MDKKLKPLHIMLNAEEAEAMNKVKQTLTTKELYARKALRKQLVIDGFLKNESL